MSSLVAVDLDTMTYGADVREYARTNNLSLREAIEELVSASIERLY